MKESIGIMSRNRHNTYVLQMWESKIVVYEIPYSVIGTIKFAGLDQQPKDICKDNNNGTRKAWNMEVLLLRKY